MARLLVTRPVEHAEPLAEHLRAQGHEVLVEPMLHVRLLDQVAVPLEGVQAVLLTSRNGARALAPLTERRDIRVIAVGEATAAEARAAGFTEVESADGDGAALIDYVVRYLRPEDGSLLHVSGFDMAVDVAAELASRGFHADRVVLYEADMADALSPAAHQALTDQTIDAVLFHSPRAAKTFAGLIDNAGLTLRLRNVTALALSRQVSEPIRHLDWQAIRIADAPNEAALLALLDAPAAAQPPAPAPRRGSPLPGLVAAGLVGLIAGGAAAYGVVRWLSPAATAPVAAADIGPLEQRLADIEQRLGAIRMPDTNDLAARLTALESRPVPPDASAQLDQLAEQVRQLESRPAAAAGEAMADSELADRVAALEQQAKALSERQGAASDLSERVATVEQRSEAISDRLAANAPPAGEARRMALVLSVNQLSEQVDSGRPYPEALAQVEALLGEDRSLLAPLRPQADSGVPTLPALRRAFDDVARDVIEAAAAGEGGHWLDHVRGRLAALFVLRRTGEVPGEAPDAIVARAEARLQDGDLAAAVAELDGLTGRAEQAAADWQRQAQIRLEAEKALAALKRRTFELARAGLK